jgi:phage FluMu protein Com
MSDTTDDVRDPRDLALDGNAAAGMLSEVFTVELTAALARCAGCERLSSLADAVTYLQAPGAVLRCRGCESVLVRVVVGPDRRWLDMTGVAVLELTSPAAPHPSG